MILVHLAGSDHWLLLNPDRIDSVESHDDGAGANARVRLSYGGVHHVQETEIEIAWMIAHWRDAIGVPFSQRAPSAPRPVYARINNGLRAGERNVQVVTEDKITVPAAPPEIAHDLLARPEPEVPIARPLGDG